MQQAPMTPVAGGVGGRALVGIDIGGTKTAALVVDEEDRVLGRAERPTQRANPVDVAVAAARAALEDAGVDPGSLSAVGVAVPGDVDGTAGVVRLAVNLDARDLPLGALMEERLGAPCFVEHDARAAAVWLSGRLGSEGDLAYLSIGTGIAAGIILGGQPLAGDNGLAGEIGHCVADPAGPLCPCGLTGCLEAIASGPAVARAARSAIDAGETSVLAAHGPAAGAPGDAGPVQLTAEAVYAAAAQGDELAARVTDAAAAALGRAARALVLGYGVSRVVIGGGPSRAGSAFTEPLQRHLAAERAASALVRRAFLAPVEVLAPDAQPTVWGAISVARSGLLRTSRHDSERRQASGDER